MWTSGVTVAAIAGVEVLGGRGNEEVLRAAFGQPWNGDVGASGRVSVRNPRNGNASEGTPAMETQRWKSSDGHRIRTHSARASVNRCLKSPREQRAWVRRQRRIGATDSGSAQDPEVERGDLESRGSQGWKRSWWNTEEGRTKQQREG